MNRPSVWTTKIGDEAAFWRAWFTEPEFADVRAARRESLVSAVFPREFVGSLGVEPGDVVRVLDVGSGPLSTLASRSPDNPVELVCVDALADVYNALLDEYGYLEVPRVIKLKGEHLAAVLTDERFHYVHVANALDHCEEPAKALSEMYRVCKPDGLIVVISVENEGERENYQGLHQWNLEANDDGLWLWNPSLRKDLLEDLGRHTYTWRYESHGQKGFKIFRVEIRKVPADVS
jgi:ubiquinone/menaquinone biosynthesis C-methylase UbiE